MTETKSLEKCTHAYIGRKACGCVVAITCDWPGFSKQTAKDVAEFIKEGLAVERVPIEEGRKMLNFCRCGNQPELFYQVK